MITDIQTINRFLASSKALEIGQRSLELDVAEYYKTQYVIPVRDSFALAKNFCLTLGFICVTDHSLQITDLGHIYLNLALKKESHYILEPNAAQKKLISNRLFEIPGIQSGIKDIFSHFKIGSHGEIFLSKAESTSIADQILFNVLIQLGVLVSNVSQFLIATQYSTLFDPIIMDSIRLISPEDFLRAEAEKIRQAVLAEKYVIKSEIRRLELNSAFDQAKRVDYVASRNVAAGYDIASFEDKDSSIFNRFIEVKSGISPRVKFYFSRNEYNAACRLKGRYYIYYVYMKNGIPVDIDVFQNPNETVMNSPQFGISTDTYEVLEKTV